jgi:hypothetical protein
MAMEPATEHDIPGEGACLARQIGEHYLGYVFCQERIAARAAEGDRVHQVDVAAHEFLERGLRVVPHIDPQQFLSFRHIHFILYKAALHRMRQEFCEFCDSSNGPFCTTLPGAFFHEYEGNSLANLFFYHAIESVKILFRRQVGYPVKVAEIMALKGFSVITDHFGLAFPLAEIQNGPINQLIIQVKIT